MCFGALPCPGPSVGLGKAPGAAGRAEQPQPWGWVMWAQLWQPLWPCKPDLVPSGCFPSLPQRYHPEPTLCHGLQGSVLTCPVARPLPGMCAPGPALRDTEVQGVPCHPCMALPRGKRVSLVPLGVFRGSGDHVPLQGDGPGSDGDAVLMLCWSQGAAWHGTAHPYPPGRACTPTVGSTTHPYSIPNLIPTPAGEL